MVLEAVRGKSYVALPLQAGMVYNAESRPRSGVDVEHVEIVVTDSFDVGAWIGAWEQVARDLDVLRTCFTWDLDAVRAVCRDIEDYEFELSRHDLSEVPLDERNNRWKELLAQDRVQGFDLTLAPLMRFVVADVGDEGTRILWSFHHAILDGRSFPLVLDRVLGVYFGEPTTTDDSSVEFHEFVTAYQALDQRPALDVWGKRLAEIEDTSTFSLRKPELTDHSGPAVLGIERTLDADSSAALSALADEIGISLNNVVQGGWGLLLRHYSRHQTVMFGSTRARRHLVPGATDTIGLLIDTAPFLLDVPPERTVRELLLGTAEEQRSLRDLEAASLADIQALRGSLLFDSMVMFDTKTLNTRMLERRPALDGSWRFRYVGQTNFALTLLVYGESEIQFRLEYDKSQYAASDAERLLEQLMMLMRALPEHLDDAALAVPFLTSADAEQLDEWNDTSNAWDIDRTLMELLEEQVQRTPDAPAIVSGDRALTFEQFNAEVNKLAHYLREQGVIPDMLVGVCAERSIEMELAIHATIKAGGAFVPLDPELPDDRLNFMVKDAQCRLVLAQDAHAERFSAGQQQVVVIDASERLWEGYSASNPEIVTRPDQLAYALFTSGSTGTPKCAMNEHRGIVNRILWMQDAFPLDESDTVLQKTPFSFDVSVWEHFWSMMFGARLVMAEPGGHRDPVYLAETIIEENVTTVHFVPSMLQLFVEEPRVAGCASLRRVIASGEALTRDLQDRLYSLLDAELHNLYGPTEAAIDVTWWHCDRQSDLSIVPIGRAIANTTIHILDPQFRPLPPGATGELHIGGIQVGRGYLNRPELTDDRFVPDPFSAGGRLYKTGDLARFMPDGNVEYLGRLDHQVKIRGQRIELGEIEAVISQHPAIREVVVMAREDQPGQQFLAGYVVGDSPDPDMVSEYCREWLAPYMVPTRWIVLDSFPLNGSGKVDRKQLPAPAVVATAARPAPTSVLEGTIVAAWTEVLGHGSFGTNDTFFDVGGSSLQIIRLAASLTETSGVEVRVADLLRSSTIVQQAEMLDRSGSGAPDVDVERGATMARRQREARMKRGKARRR